MELLQHIDDPSRIRDFDSAKLKKLCAELREYIIQCCSENPGHIGSSLGAVEIAVAIHKVFDTPHDKVVWDVGHQAYAHKILTGRREAFRLNRRKEGISGFPKISESPYDAFGTGHSSTSISAALGMAVASALQHTGSHSIAVIGDGALTGGMAFEGLNNAGSLKTDLLVILNDNQISIDKNLGGLHNYLIKVTTSEHYNRLKKGIWDHLGVSRLRDDIQKAVKKTKKALLKYSDTGSFFEALGFRYFGPIDGNDIDQMVTILSRLKKVEGPKLLHVITTKGKGYAPAEQNQTIWHAPGTFDIETGRRTGRKSDISKYQEVFGTTLLELARKDRRIVGITPAMATGCSMDIMMKEMPGRVFDVTIAEQHAVTFSAGLASCGMLPVCNIYSSFSQRAFDSIIHDVALQNLKVIICLDRAGIVGEDGPTHHGAFDMASYRPIPNIYICAPLDELELRNMLYSSTLPQYGSTIIRYPRGCGEGTAWRDMDFSFIEPGKARKLRSGTDVALLSIGAIGNKGRKAADICATDGISVEHWDMRFLKPVDKEALKDICGRFNKIVTLEDGAVCGGLGAAVSQFVTEEGLGCTVLSLGMPDRFVSQGKPEELYTDCGYNTDDIVSAIKKLNKKNNEKK